MSEDDAPEAEARAFLGLEKNMAIDDLSWKISPDNSAYRVYTCPLLDASGISIPGFNIELAYRAPARFDDCKYTFSIFRFRAGGVRQRVYQLEVIPVEDRGHNDEVSPCYGPHEHIGTHVEEVRVGNLDCKHHEKWFRVFLSRAAVGYVGLYSGPFDGGLFNDM